MVVGEADARYVLTEVLAARGVRFGLEVPTQKSYRFKGKAAGRGLTDVVIEPDGQAVKIEMKVHANADHAEFRGLERDLEKLIKEPATGAASFHILQESTRSRLLRGYRTAYADAKRRTARLRSRSIVPKWFVLFIFDRRTAVACWQTWEDMRRCSEVDFVEGKFSVADLQA